MTMDEFPDYRNSETVLNLLTVRPGSPVIDSDRGDGALTEKRSSCGQGVTGIDASESMLRPVREK